MVELLALDTLGKSSHIEVGPESRSGVNRGCVMLQITGADANYQRVYLTTLQARTLAAALTESARAADKGGG